METFDEISQKAERTVDELAAFLVALPGSSRSKVTHIGKVGNRLPRLSKCGPQLITSRARPASQDLLSLPSHRRGTLAGLERVAKLPEGIV